MWSLRLLILILHPAAEDKRSGVVCVSSDRVTSTTCETETERERDDDDDDAMHVCVNGRGFRMIYTSIDTSWRFHVPLEDFNCL